MADAPEIPTHPRLVEGAEVLAYLRHEETVAFPYARNRGMFLFATLVALCCAFLVVSLIVRTDTMSPVSIAAASLLGLTAIGSVWAAIHWFFFSIRNYVALRPGLLVIGRGERAWLFPSDRLTRETIRFDAMRRGTHTIELPIVDPPAEARVLLLHPFVELKNHRTFLAEILALLVDEDAETSEEPASEAPQEQAPRLPPARRSRKGIVAHRGVNAR